MWLNCTDRIQTWHEIVRWPLKTAQVTNTEKHKAHLPLSGRPCDRGSINLLQASLLYSRLNTNVHRGAVRWKEGYKNPPGLLLKGAERKRENQTPCPKREDLARHWIVVGWEGSRRTAWIAWSCGDGMDYSLPSAQLCLCGFCIIWNNKSIKKVTI